MVEKYHIQVRKIKMITLNNGDLKKVSKLIRKGDSLVEYIKDAEYASLIMSRIHVYRIQPFYKENKKALKKITNKLKKIRKQYKGINR